MLEKTKQKRLRKLLTPQQKSIVHLEGGFRCLDGDDRAAAESLLRRFNLIGTLTGPQWGYVHALNGLIERFRETL